MSRRWKGLAVLGVLLSIVGWYAFRPERAFITRRVDESPPSANAVVLAHGEFVSRAHDGHGTAQLLRLGDGQRVLRLSAFGTLNGPDLQVYLLGDGSASSRSDLQTAGYLSLGALKGNAGDQNYAIPADADLTRYRAVSVWCRRFGVNFTTAPLAPPAGS